MNSLVFRSTRYRYNLKVHWCWNGEIVTSVIAARDFHSNLDGMWSFDRAGSSITAQYYEPGLAYRRAYARVFDPALGRTVKYPYWKRYTSRQRSYFVRAEGRFTSNLPGKTGFFVNTPRQPWIEVRATHYGSLILLRKDAG